MGQDLKECAKIFLKEQGRLFDKPVAETLDEAEAFLEDCFAQVFGSLKDVRAYLKEEGMDVAGMNDEELRSQSEVFAIGDGRYFVVEA